jgi:integrase/recombinase XerD
LIRPENPDGYLFLSKRSHDKLDPMYVNEAVKEGFTHINESEKYERYRKITSHYGRHFFSTF